MASPWLHFLVLRDFLITFIIFKILYWGEGFMCPKHELYCWATPPAQKASFFGGGGGGAGDWTRASALSRQRFYHWATSPAPKRLFKKSYLNWMAVAHSCNSNPPEEEEAGGLWVLPGQPELHSKFNASLGDRVRSCLKKQNKTNKQKKTPQKNQKTKVYSVCRAYTVKYFLLHFM
jgi:hypothetical protein